MKIQTIRHENVNPAGHLPGGGAVEVDGTVRMGNLGRFEEPWIAIFAPLKDGVVTGIRVIFDSREEYEEFLLTGEITGVCSE